jgi:gas vesicle protein
MNMPLHERRDHGFIIGLLTGTCVGAGLMLWLAPRMVIELRQRVTDSVDNLARKGQSIRDEVADRVAHGAHEVERFARAAKTASPVPGEERVSG